MSATTSTQRTTRYSSMPERIEALATERRLLAQADGSYLVESSTGGEYYRVTAEQCGCPSFQRRGGPCKHQGLISGLLANLQPSAADRRAVAIYARSEGRARLGLTAPVGADRAFAELFG